MYSGESDQEDPEDEEVADEELPGIENPTLDADDARASTPFRQDPESSDSEDESVLSPSEDGGADRMEKLFGAAHREIHIMPLLLLDLRTIRAPLQQLLRVLMPTFLGTGQ